MNIHIDSVTVAVPTVLKDWGQHSPNSEAEVFGETEDWTQGDEYPNLCTVTVVLVC